MSDPPPSGVSPVPGRSGRFALLAAVIGPGVLAGLSDDDPAGITTYSILGANYGYSLLWVLALSTGALVLFHTLGARMGVVTGQGVAGLLRGRYGVRRAGVVVAALVVANIGTAAAEFAGVAAGLELAGVSRYLSVPAAGVACSALVLGGSFHRVERVLLALASVFVTYVFAGFAAKPDWAAAARGLTVPSMPTDRAAVMATTATIGTTLAPWGLAFIQSYAADKRLRVEDLRRERLDVVVGSVLTGVIGLFVVVACAATLHRSDTTIHDAADAARALQPFAGRAAGALFGTGLVGAALLAASVLPLSTAYSVSEFFGYEAAVDDRPGEAPVFYATFATVVALAGAMVLLPGAPLVPILYGTQALNAVLLVPLLVAMVAMASDREVMGDHAVGRPTVVACWATIVLIAGCVVALAVTSLA